MATINLHFYFILHTSLTAAHPACHQSAQHILASHFALVVALTRPVISLLSTAYGVTFHPRGCPHPTCHQSAQHSIWRHISPSWLPSPDLSSTCSAQYMASHFALVVALAQPVINLLSTAWRHISPSWLPSPDLSSTCSAQHFVTFHPRGCPHPTCHQPARHSISSHFTVVVFLTSFNIERTLLLYK